MINKIAGFALQKRKKQIASFMQYPIETQEKVFQQLIQAGKETAWGKAHHYPQIRSWQQYSQQVPITAYEDLEPYIRRIFQGEKNVLWNSPTHWMAKSSGTTSSKSKFIPLTKESLRQCHYQAGIDMLVMYHASYPDSRVFTGANLALGGSQDLATSTSNLFCGDLSAILIDNLPLWAEYFRTPSKKVALMSEWENKLTCIIEAGIKKSIVSLSGVPSWMMLVLQGVLQRTGKNTIKEVWPNLEVYFHGGVAFTPYREQYRRLIGEPMRYMETYNASEGFFGIQDRKDLDSMLLLLDYGIFYEFLPLGADHSDAIPLSEIEVGKNYAMIISTNGGLWRYMIGDTVTFTEKNPYRFKITGRTKNFINACGEEIIIDNATAALAEACRKTNAIINEYTAAPLFNDTNNTKQHEWMIEFTTPPTDITLFAEILDQTLQNLNSDYEAKRYKDLVLQKPVIESVPHDTFYQWLKSRGRLGGQYKVPRLCNDRTHIEQIKEIIHQTNL